MTTGFSAQKLIQDVLNRSVTFVYWGVIYNNNTNFTYETLFDFSPALDTHKFTNNWGFMEFLMTSPEPPIVGVKLWKPIFQ